MFTSQTVKWLSTHLLPRSYSWPGVLRASAHRAGASNVLAPLDLHQMRKLVSGGCWVVPSSPALWTKACSDLASAVTHSTASPATTRHKCCLMQAGVAFPPGPPPLSEDLPSWTDEVAASCLDVRRRIFCNRSLNMTSIQVPAMPPAGLPDSLHLLCTPKL